MPQALAPPTLIRRLGQVDYLSTWEAMRAFTTGRDGATPDEIWLLEHPPVYTLGLAGRPEHLLADTGIPLVRTDRGGQITYHGPGQIVVYLLLDLHRRRLGVRELVHRLEGAVVDLLAAHGVQGDRWPGAPGVYVAGAKIAALGLRIKQGCSYHGLALNVDGDLGPFAAIDPCGYPGLRVTRTLEVGIRASMIALSEELLAAVGTQLDAAPGLSGGVDTTAP